MSSRKKDDVKTTMDMVSIYTARFSIGNATGTLITSTDMKTTISGTANGTNSGQFQLTLGSDNQACHVLHWNAALQSTTGQANVYALTPVTASAAGGTFTVLLTSGTLPQAGNSYAGTIVSGQTAAQIALAGLTGSIFAVVRDTKRLR